MSPTVKHERIQSVCANGVSPNLEWLVCPVVRPFHTLFMLWHLKSLEYTIETVLRHDPGLCREGEQLRFGFSRLFVSPGSIVPIFALFSTDTYFQISSSIASRTELSALWFLASNFIKC